MSSADDDIQLTLRGRVRRRLIPAWNALRGQGVIANVRIEHTGQVDIRPAQGVMQLALYNSKFSDDVQVHVHTVRRGRVPARYVSRRH